MRKTFEAGLPWGACCQGKPPVDLGLDDECDKNAILGGWDGIGSLSGVRYRTPYDGDNAEGGDVRMLKIDRGKDYQHQNDNEGAGYDLNLDNDDDYQ